MRASILRFPLKRAKRPAKPEPAPAEKPMNAVQRIKQKNDLDLMVRVLQEAQAAKEGRESKGERRMNTVIVTGRMTADPELRHTQGEKPVPVCTFILAVDRPTSDDTADFPTIVAWRDTAVFVSRYLRKGRKIIVRGEIRTRNYEDKDGNRRKVTEIQADRIEFADSRIPEKEDEEGTA